MTKQTGRIKVCYKGYIGGRFFFVLLIALLSLNCQAQDSISYKGTSVNHIFMGAPQTTLKSHFGRPDKIIRDTDYSTGEVYYKLVYKKSKFQVSKAEKTFFGFDINDPLYTVCYKSACFKIGDEVSSLSALFPESYQFYLLDKKKYPKEKMLPLRVKFAQSDSYLIFECVGERIRSISTWDDL
ncbi:hypothetical protein CJD36_012165 [Flavipsychrobacter stenotrophus]|uniref:Uncharacterized protein n=2 Tax=Flavipsychrobacter stenotrophus TaxID=2077091 RepID=A0A2S7SUY0_9BACT|nr:hypothetical protein CJD36_012165 [Flavipsychrobacter stenotrophus]